MGAFLQDVRYGLRKLRRSPGFTILAVLTLALGIGANTAVFSLVYGVLLRPLSYPHADRLVTPVWTEGNSGGIQSNVTIPEFRFWRDHSHVFESLAAYSTGGFNLSGAGMADRIQAEYISADFFPTLGVHPALGRNFLPQEDQGTGQPVAILSYALWASHFGADANVLGKTVALDGQPYTVIGVMPSSFQPVEQGDMWIPIARLPGPQAGGDNQQVIGRLKPGLSLSQAQAGMQVVAEEFERANPRRYPPGFGIRLIPLQTFLGMGAQSYLLLLFGAIGMVLLIACANVAGLLVARAAARGREIALRQTLGASRGRLIRQLLTESVLLALAGAAAGIPVAYGGLNLLLGLVPSSQEANPLIAQLVGSLGVRSADIGINGGSLVFALGLGFATAIIFGLLPAWQAATKDSNEVLKEGAFRSTAAASHSRLRGGLVVAEMAVTVVLLAGALLLARTFVNLLRVGPGFETGHLLSVQLWMNGSRYQTSPALAGFYQSVTAKTDQLPGVVSAGVTSGGMPLETGGNFPVEIEGVPDIRSADIRAVDRGYFRALGVPLMAGRWFAASDAAGASPVAIVNRSFARRYFGNANALGRHIVIGATIPEKAFVDPPREIVGVVGDVKTELNLPADPTMFVPVAQASYATMELFGGIFPTDLLVRTAGDPLLAAGPVRRVLASLDPGVPVGRIRTMDQVRAASVGLERFMAALMGIFAALALLLSALGIYGVLSYSVAQRTPEIGVRMALGAQRGDVLRMVLGYAGALAALGILIGAAGAYALTRLMASLLFGIRPTDPVSFLATAGLLAVVALAACAVPAWRAMRVEPVVALRYE
jgi:putative ABC transport system permease protein